MVTSVKRIFCCLAICALLASLSSCRRGDSTATNRPTVAFISNNAYDFWLIAKKGTEDAAKKYNINAEFKMPKGGGTAEEQQNIIEDLLTRGVKGIAISPNDSKNMESFLRGVFKRVPLITQDSDVPDPSARFCYIGTNNYKAGWAAGELVKEVVKDGGKIVIFVGKLDVQNAVERRQGVLDALAGRKDNESLTHVDEPDAANLKVGNYILLDTKTDGGERNICQQRAEEILTKYPDVACLVGLWEYNPPAMLQAVRDSKNAAKPAIIGFDENYETLQGIQKGFVHATVVQDPYTFGFEAVKILAALADGKRDVLLGRKDIDDQNRIFIPHRVINKENVDDFYKKLQELKGK